MRGCAWGMAQRRVGSHRGGDPAAASRPAALVVLLAALVLAGCAGPGAVVRRGWTQVGLASWYGKPYHGRRTASGEVYNMYGVSAAHRTLPFGTRVRVTRLDNGRSIVVRINDRGPFVRGRIIDLSYGAAKKLGMVQEGVVKVRIEVL